MASDDPTILEIMIKEPRTVLSQSPPIQAAQTMVEFRIRHLVVTETDGEVVGVISERQILRHFSPWLSKAGIGNEFNLPFPRSNVQDIMAQPPVTIGLDTSIRAAAAIMASRKIGCLPVVQGHMKMAGLVTATDLLKFVGANHLPDLADDFHVFRPPALLKKDGNLTVPLGYLPEIDPEQEVFAVLAYAADSNRIGIKFCAKDEEGAGLLGARLATVTDEYVAVPVDDFIEHHNLDIYGSLEVSDRDGTGYLVLSPVLKP
jgi:CBS domain-containing protein